MWRRLFLIAVIAFILAIASHAKGAEGSSSVESTPTAPPDWYAGLSLANSPFDGGVSLGAFALRAKMTRFINERFGIAAALSFGLDRFGDDVASNAYGKDYDVIHRMYGIGLSAELYVTGSTSEGGLLVSPNVYGIAWNGVKEDRKGRSIITSSESKAGLRTGVDISLDIKAGNELRLAPGVGVSYYVAKPHVSFPGLGVTEIKREDPADLTLFFSAGFAF